ncbi:MAG TPA: PAS-domain containing protein [Rhizomicrobium sp.]
MAIYPAVTVAVTKQVAPPPLLHPKADGEFALATIAIGAVLIGLLCSSLLVSVYVRFVNFRRETRVALKIAEDSIHLRDLLLSAGPDAALVLGNGPEQPFSVGSANVWLRHAMDGPDGKRVAKAIDGLMRGGEEFQLSARTSEHGLVALRGKTAGQRAIVYLRDVDWDQSIDYRAVIDAMPVPVWVRGEDLSLRWANQAYLEAVGANSLTDIQSTGAALERSEVQLAEAAQDSLDAITATRYTLIEGKRRALNLSLARLPDAAIAGIALDVTPVAQAEARLRLSEDAASDLLEAIPAGVAVFGEDRRIATYNIRYAQTWDLNPDWLDTHPTLGDILDRLRDTRQLPEQPDFQSWKRSQIELFETCKSEDTFWHTRQGRSISLKIRPHLQGGLFFIIEDVTEKLRLEASFKLLNQVQRATLDAVDEAIAIFAPDGHLVLHNKHFGKLWQLSEEELSAQPHFRKIANLCEARIGHDGLWSIVAAGVTADEPERCAAWGKTPRADGRTISISMSRLPNGATAVTFTDYTDLMRFEAAQAEASHVAA